MKSSILRWLVLVTVVALVAAACGDDEGGGDPPDDPVATTVATTLPPDTTLDTTVATTLAPATTTTMATTTTAAPTTTAATTTTTAAGDPQERVDAKLDAVAAAAPDDGWTSEVDADTFGTQGDTNEIYGPCAPPGAFDLLLLDDVSLAVGEVTVTAPPSGVFPPPEGTVEARIFESEETAASAFEVLETVLGTEGGRDCLAGNFLDTIADDTPVETEFSIAIAEGDVPGADVAVLITLTLVTSSLTVDFFVEIGAARDGDCTVFGTFQSFSEEFPQEVQGELMQAAFAG